MNNIFPPLSFYKKLFFKNFWEIRSLIPGRAIPLGFLILIVFILTPLQLIRILIRPSILNEGFVFLPYPSLWNFHYGMAVTTCLLIIFLVGTIWGELKNYYIYKEEKRLLKMIFRLLVVLTFTTIIPTIGGYLFFNH